MPFHNAYRRNFVGHPLRLTFTLSPSKTSIFELMMTDLESNTGRAKQAVSESQLDSNDSKPSGNDWPLSLEEYQRYGRQLITPQVKLDGK
jgi:hypothetical protein